MVSNEVRSRIGRSWITIDAHPDCMSKTATRSGQINRAGKPGTKPLRGLAPIRRSSASPLLGSSSVRAATVQVPCRPAGERSANHTPFADPVTANPLEQRFLMSFLQVAPAVLVPLVKVADSSLPATVRRIRRRERPQRTSIPPPFDPNDREHKMKSGPDRGREKRTGGWMGHSKDARPR